MIPTSPGYRTFDVRPRPGGGLGQVDLRLDTRSGTIEIDWTLDDGGFELGVTVPQNTEARVYLPTGEVSVAPPGRHSWKANH